MQYAGIESHEMFPCQRKSTRVFTALVSVLDPAVAVVWALVLLIDNCGDSHYDAPTSGHCPSLTCLRHHRSPRRCIKERVK